MIRGAQHHSPAFLHLDQGAQATVEHILAERRVDHGGHSAKRPAAVAAAEIRYVLHGQAGFFGDHIDVGGVLQSRISQLILSIVEQAFGFDALVFGFQFRLGLFKGFHGGRLNPIELQNVISELRFHGAANFIDLHGEGRVGEGSDKNLAIRPAEIAALRRGSRILRKFLRQFRKVLASLRAL